MKSVLQMTVLLLVILLATFYLVLPKREGFLNLSGVNSISLYKNAGKNASPAQIDADFTAVEPTLADKGSLLHMRRCYQFPNESLESFRQKFTYSFNNDGMYYVDFDMITCKFSDVESRIVCELQNFKDKLCGVQGKINCGTARTNTKWTANSKCDAVTPVVTGVQSTDPECLRKIQGPVYALVFQAPYYRVKDTTVPGGERMISLQFQTLDTMLMPYNGLQKSDDSNTPIFVYVQLLFPRYNKNGTYMPQVNYMDQYFFPEWDRKYFSKEMQCFIKTVGKLDTVGGCATTKSPYEAVCLGPKTAVNFAEDDEKGTISTYGVLYQINRSYALFQDLFYENIPALQPPIQMPEVFYMKGAFTDVRRATEECSRVGAVIASREDAYDAYAAGHNVCEPGFVSDGYIASSSQGTLSACQNNKGFNLMSNQKQPNVGVFCYGVRPKNESSVSAWDARGFLSKLDWLSVPQNVPQSKCGTFSEEKYFAKYPDAKESGQKGVQHWVNIGMAKGYKGFLKESDFSGVFDDEMYSKMYTGQISNQTGLQHLIEKGVAEDRWVCLK
jgi:hypothetical protein